MSLTSLVVVCYNNSHLTDRCIQTIEENTSNYELILIDNNSLDNTREVLSKYTDRHTVILNDENFGYAYAINQGILVAKGDQIVILNNDLAFTPRWLDEMLVHLKDNNIVAPLSSFCYGAQEVIGYPNNASAEQIAEGLYFHNKGKGKVTHFASGFCLLMSRKLIDTIGLFDPDLKLGGDDFELTMRIRENGGHYVIALGSFVFHVGHQAFKSDEEASAKMNNASWHSFNVKHGHRMNGLGWNEYFFGDDQYPGCVWQPPSTDSNT